MPSPFSARFNDTHINDIQYSNIEQYKKTRHSAQWHQILTVVMLSVAMYAKCRYAEYLGPSGHNRNPPPPHTHFNDFTMDKLKLTGRALSRVFNSRSSCYILAKYLLSSAAIWPNLELKTLPKQLLGSLPLVTALPDFTILCTSPPPAHPHSLKN